MNAEIKKRWLEALRSGEYKQGRGHLRQYERGEHTYCCLGVLCDLYVQEKRNMWYEDLEHSNVSELHNVDELPPDVVVDWADLPESDPQLNGLAISSWNDSHKKDFKYIADLIEKEL